MLVSTNPLGAGSGLYRKLRSTCRLDHNLLFMILLNGGKVQSLVPVLVVCMRLQEFIQYADIAITSDFCTMQLGASILGKGDSFCVHIVKTWYML